MTSPSRDGRIVTFYSFKGGTGRSMMLANVAWLLADNGYKVLTVDWDLEAPGLHRYLRPFLADQDLTRTEGVIDFASDYCVAAALAGGPDGSRAGTKVRATDAWYQENADLTRYAVPVQWPFSGSGSLEFVGAGRQGASYSTRVNGFSWRDFYTRFAGAVMLGHAKRLMRERFDYVLVDSRTGVSDTSGICTVELPDALVVCHTLNFQSVDGAAAVARSARGQKPELALLPVPMRIDNSEISRLEARRRYARAAFEGLVPVTDAREVGAYWSAVEVPYVPFYAYEETLATFKDTPGTAYTVLSVAERLATRVVEATSPRGLGRPDLRAKRMPEGTRREYITIYETGGARPEQRSQSGPSVFVSYRREDARYAREVYSRLSDAMGEHRVFMDTGMVPGEDWGQATSAAIQQAAAMIVVLGPSWHQPGAGEFVAKEVERASG